MTERCWRCWELFSLRRLPLGNPAKISNFTFPKLNLAFQCPYLLYVLCYLSVVNNILFLRLTLISVYSTSFLRPQKVSIFVRLINKSPRPMPLSSAPGDVAIVSHSSLVYSLLPLIHLPHCCYRIRLLTFDLSQSFSEKCCKAHFCWQQQFYIWSPNEILSRNFNMTTR